MEAVPGASRMAILADPTNTVPARLQILQDAARGRGVELVVFTARTPEEIPPAMNQIKASGGRQRLALRNVRRAMRTFECGFRSDCAPRLLIKNCDIA
jgi:hypothetical protein